MEVKNLLRKFSQISCAVFYYQFCLTQELKELETRVLDDNSKKQRDLLECLIDNYQLATLLNFETRDNNYKDSILNEVHRLHHELKEYPDPSKLLSKIKYLYQIQRNLHVALLELEVKNKHLANWASIEITISEDYSNAISEIYQNFCNENEINASEAEKTWDMQVSQIYQYYCGDSKFLSYFLLAYDGLTELVDKEKNFITDCHKFDVAGCTNAITNYHNWKKEKTRPDKLVSSITSLASQAIGALNNYKKLENHFEFTFLQAVRCAYDISIFVHEVFAILCGSHFSLFYSKQLLEITTAYEKVLCPILQQISEDKDYSVSKASSKEDEKEGTNIDERIKELALIADAPNILIKPCQRVGHYFLTFKEVAKNFESLLKLKLPFRDFPLLSVNNHNQRNLPISPSMPLQPYQVQKVIPFPDLFVILLAKLPERAKILNSKIGALPRTVSYRRELSNNQSTDLSRVTSPNVGRVQKLDIDSRTLKTSAETLDFERVPSTFKIDDTDGTLSQLDPTNAYASLHSLTVKHPINRPLSEDYHKVENQTALEILKKGYYKNPFYKKMLIDFINQHQDPLIILNKLPIRMRVRWIVDTLEKGIRESSSKKWKTGFFNVGAPQHCIPIIHLLNTHRQQNLNSEEVMRELIRLGTLARDYKPCALNLFYHRYPETQQFYNILARLNPREAENVVSNVDFRVGSQQLQLK